MRRKSSEPLQPLTAPAHHAALPAAQLLKGRKRPAGDARVAHLQAVWWDELAPTTRRGSLMLTRHLCTQHLRSLLQESQPTPSHPTHQQPHLFRSRTASVASRGCCRPSAPVPSVASVPAADDGSTEASLLAAAPAAEPARAAWDGASKSSLCRRRWRGGSACALMYSSGEATCGQNQAPRECDCITEADVRGG